LLEEWSSEESIEFTQLMIVWFTRGSQVDYCISTLQISAMSRECFTSSRQARERFTGRGFTGRCVGRYGGVYDLSVEQVGAHSSHRIDAVFGHFGARGGEHVDRLHHRFIESTVGKYYVCSD
jgi:hypothetical protein